MKTCNSPHNQQGHNNASYEVINPDHLLGMMLRKIIRANSIDGLNRGEFPKHQKSTGRKSQGKV